MASFLTLIPMLFSFVPPSRSARAGLAAVAGLLALCAVPATAQGAPEASGDGPVAVTLQTVPRVVYKEANGVWEPDGTESWSFAVLVQEAEGRMVTPLGATVEMTRRDTLVRRVELSAEEVEAVAGRRYAGALYQQDEVFDLRHHFTAPEALGVDRLAYTLHWAAEGDTMHTRLDLPLSRYEPRTDLIFPLAGRFVIAAGHAADEDHPGAWSQDFADDIIALGERFEVMREPDGMTNESVVTWRAEILAPAAGTVVYARNDVPDNPVGEFDLRALLQLPDPINAIGGNTVIIDHGTGEFSFLAHLAQGSVRVETGDTVEQGQVIGLLGNSGSSDGPHLHYHLMDGPVMYRSNSLPTRFSNVVDPIFAGEDGPFAVPNPKRGTFLYAVPME